MPEQDFFFDSFQEAETITQYLDSLMRGSGDSKLVLGTAENAQTLHPEGKLKITFRADKKQEKDGLSVKISWGDKRKENDPREFELLGSRSGGSGRRLQ